MDAIRQQITALAKARKNPQANDYIVKKLAEIGKEAIHLAKQSVKYGHGSEIGKETGNDTSNQIDAYFYAIFYNHKIEKWGLEGSKEAIDPKDWKGSKIWGRIEALNDAKKTPDGFHTRYHAGYTLFIGNAMPYSAINESYNHMRVVTQTTAWMQQRVEEELGNAVGRIDLDLIGF